MGFIFLIFLVMGFGLGFDLAATLLRLGILRLADLHNWATFTKGSLARITAVDGLAGHDTVDF